MKGNDAIPQRKRMAMGEGSDQRVMVKKAKGGPVYKPAGKMKGKGRC